MYNICVVLNANICERENIVLQSELLSASFQSMIPSVAACPDAAFSIPGKGIGLHFSDLQIVIRLFSRETWIFISRPESANA